MNDTTNHPLADRLKKITEGFKKVEDVIRLRTEMDDATDVVMKPGDIDVSFGDSGRLVDASLGMALPTHDGKYWILSNLRTNTTGTIRIKRVLEDGSPAPDFPLDGKIVTVHPAGNIDIITAALQSNGKIIIAGELKQATPEASFVTSIHPDGTLDTSFGDGGIKLIELDENAPIIGVRDLTIQADDKIVLAVLASGPINSTVDTRVVRLTAEGRLDESFGDGGVVLDPSEMAMLRLAADRAGNLVLGGPQDADAVLVRMTTHGNYDQTFGAGGIVRWQAPDGAAMDITCLAIDDDDSIAVGGRINTEEHSGYWIAKVLPSGHPDYEFNSGKLLLFDDQISTISVQTGQLVVHGLTTVEPDISRMYVKRINRDGSLDTTFGSGGIVVVPPPVDASDDVFRSHAFVQVRGQETTLFVSDVTTRFTRTYSRASKTFFRGVVVETQLVRFILVHMNENEGAEEVKVGRIDETFHLPNHRS